MKKKYCQPKATLVELTDMHSEMEDTTMPIYTSINGGGNHPVVEEPGEILAKPTTLYDVWEDEDKEIDFHTDV
jgi:hypothetical protein